MEKGNYGTRHVMEEEMREAGVGVFEKPRRKAKDAGAAPENKSAKAKGRK